MEKKLSAWTEMVEQTDVVNEKELKELFPEALIIKEWLFFTGILLTKVPVYLTGITDP